MLVQTTSIKSVTWSFNMDVFRQYRDNESSEPQIRQPISCLYGFCLLCSTFLAVALLFKADLFLCIGMSLFAILYGVLTYKNDRVTYNADGITFFTIWGKPYRKTWNEVHKVEIVIEPLISRQYMVGPVLKIQCLEQKRNRHAITTYRFPYKYYIGIEEFLSFYHQIISPES